MSRLGFTIVKIAVQGPKKTDAILEFERGLNVIAGASNTGKTYAWQLIDFMLGALKPPKDISQSRGYTHGVIEVSLNSGGTLTLRRPLAGGPAEVFTIGIDAIDDEIAVEIAGEKHKKSDATTISGRILMACGLLGKQIRKDANGLKNSLSFRDVARFVFVDEERVITERSPILSTVREDETKSKSAFGLVLTGIDDSAIVSTERPKDRKLRLATEVSVLADLLGDRKDRFKEYSIDPSQLVEQRLRIAQAVEEATRLVATRQTELDEVAAARDQAWGQLQSLKSKHNFLTEQLSRLVLLQKHYTADKNRLESSMEAGSFFEQLPGGDCPVCGHAAADAEKVIESDARLQDFQKSCIAEIRKLSVLTRDLSDTLSSMRNREQEIVMRQTQLRETLDQVNADIAGLLNQNVRDANDELSQLIAQQIRLAEAANVLGEVEDLQTRFLNAEQLKKAKNTRTKFSHRANAAGTADFCDTVKQTLRSWKFPVQGNIAWSDSEFDLVIGNENRGSMGKGYRAVSHAAFVISLMRYCRKKKLPHPGVVVIDSPLNPFKGADKDGEERVNTEVQEAFYADLSSDKSGDQLIVFENTEPPLGLRKGMRYTHFSGNAANPRAGFFPTS